MDSTGLSTLISEIDYLYTDGAAERDLRKVFESELKIITWSERQIARIIPWLIEELDSEELRAILQSDIIIKKEQYKMLEAIFNTFEVPVQEKRCEAIDALIVEIESTLNKIADMQNATRDKAVITALQKIEHYQIAAYGSLCILSTALNLEEFYPILESTLMEKMEGDKLLSESVETYVYEHAA